MKSTLLDSAETLARSRGFDAFSYADLSSEVGIRKASIHHHFPAKADLAFALIDRYSDRFATNLAALDHAEKASDRMRGFLNIYRLALAEGTQLCLCVAFSAGRESFAPNVIAALTQFHTDTLSWLTRVCVLGQSDGSISDLTNPQAEAAAIQALVEGAQLMARAAEDVAPFDQATAALLARLT